MLVAQFAELINRTPAAVTERLRKNKPYKAIRSFKKVGNTYSLVVNRPELSKLVLKNTQK